MGTLCFGTRWKIGLAALVFLLGCSERHAGGNSAETGNPEIAGTVTLPDGQAASAARLQCLPRDFDARTDTVDARWLAVADSLGNFHFDDQDAGSCNLEAYHGESGFRLFIAQLPIAAERTLQVRATLSQPGAVRLGLTGFAEGDSGWVWIPGTSIVQAVTVQYASLFIDSLPVAELDSIIFIPAQGGAPVLLSTDVKVLPGQITTQNAEPLHIETELQINTSSLGADLKETLYGFPLAWRLDSKSVDFRLLRPTSGKLSVWRKDRELGYQISQWDTQTQKAALWVRLDTLWPQNANQTLRLVYDEKPAATTNWSTPPFALADSTTAVWHLEEAGDTAYDAGPYRLNGIRHGAQSHAGVVGNANWFNGTSNYISIPESANGPLNFGYSAPATFSVWVRLDVPNTSRFVFGKGIYQYHLKYQYPTGWTFENNDAEAITRYHRYDAPLDTLADQGKWFHLAVAIGTGGADRLFVNGTLADTIDTYFTQNTLRYTGNTFEIGRRILPDLTTGQHFWGVIDELQIWHVSHSAEWIRMLYLNQNPLSPWPAGNAPATASPSDF